MLVTKIDAARRQLEAAIELYFAGRDPVAVHTLAAAAEGVLAGLLEGLGRPNELLQQIMPEHRKMVLRKMREAQNFFKHADRDADAVLEFEPDSTEVVLFMACRSHAELAKNTTPMVCMTWWMLLHHPDLLLDPADREQAQKLRARMQHWDRQRYWKEMHRGFAEAALS
jgi:hypothetical protein